MQAEIMCAILCEFILAFPSMQPLLPGVKRQKEPWENMWYFALIGNFLLATFILYFKPDNSMSTWARIQAEKRLREREEGSSTEEQEKS